jgi:hypothetical protein
VSHDADTLHEQIIKEIHQAFAHVSRGNGVTLHEAEVIDDYGSPGERKSARALDLDERWQDVPDHLIEDHHDTLCFVDPKGFCYYLPAYMVWALRNYKTSDSLSSDHPIYSLMLDGDSSMREWHLNRFKRFDNQQAKAICRFLRFMSKDEDHADAVAARKALDQYWGRFCETPV